MLGVHTPMPGRRPQSSSLGCSLHSSPAQGRPLYVPKGGPSLLTHPGHGRHTQSVFQERLLPLPLAENNARGAGLSISEN